MAEETLDKVLSELGKVAFAQADDSNGSAMKYASKLKALEILGKHYGLYERQEDGGLVVRIVDDIPPPEAAEKSEG